MTTRHAAPARTAGLAAAAVAAVVAVLLLGGAPALADPDRGSIGIRLLDAPVDRADDPRAHTSVVDHLRPGAAIERRVEVTNHTDGTVTLPLYVGGAALAGEAFQPHDERDRGDLAHWGMVEPAEVTLGPGQSAQPTVRIAVPSDATAGERYGVIWVETPRATQGSLEVVNRVGVRVYLSVGEGGEPVSDFEIVDLVAARDAAGNPVVEARVENTGGRALDVTGDLTLSDGPGGISAGPFPRARGATLAPGEQGTVPFVLDPELPDGPWTARVDLHSGTIERSAEARLTFPGEAGTAGPAIDAEPVDPRGEPATAVAIGLLLVLVVAILLVLLARRRRREDEDEAAPGAGDARPAGRSSREPASV